MKNRIIPTILCGGAGARLWPVSREQHPKPFIQLSDGQSLLYKTFLRASLLPTVNEILTVTNRELLFKTEDEFRKANRPDLNQIFILEPSGRNTAGAIALAALQIIASYEANTLMLVLPADHLVSDQKAFAQAVEQAVELALQNRLVALGIKPEHPEPGYGYIETENGQVRRFIEKPTLEKAMEFFHSGQFLWNSGIFCFTADTLIGEMEKHCPEILFATKTCLEQARLATGKHFSHIELDEQSFALVPENSIDYALMEKSEQVAVVPSNMAWSDIGSWGAIDNLNKSDNFGNRIEGEVLLNDVTNCYIRSHERLVGAIGVKDLFIIDTPDALLVADKSRAQDVKRLYQQLKEQNHETHKIHRTVHRPWGSYTILEEGPRFKIKRIEVKPGASLSLQMHHHRSEHWIVVSGMAKVINGEREIYVNTNESTYIPAGFKHRLENTGVIPLVMIEVQSGEYMGEDDIIRFEDDYGRV